MSDWFVADIENAKSMNSTATPMNSITNAIPVSIFPTAESVLQV